MAAAYRGRRFLSRVLPLKRAADPADDRQLPATLSDILRAMTYWEWHLSLKVAKLPVGISYLAIARNRFEPNADSRGTRKAG